MQNTKNILSMDTGIIIRYSGVKQSHILGLRTSVLQTTCALCSYANLVCPKCPYVRGIWEVLLSLLVYNKQIR